MRTQVVLRVPAVGGPVFEAVLRLQVTALAAFHVSNQFFMPSAGSDDPNVLMQERMTQRIVPDPEVPGGYVSYWDMDRDAVTTSQRKGNGLGVGPFVNFGIEWTDPEGVSDPFNGYIFTWWARAVVKTWWGSMHP
jgi:hypothetical protein